MALNIWEFIKGLRIKPTTTSTISQAGEMEVLDSDNRLRYHDGTSISTFVTPASTDTLENKTLVNPIINNTIVGPGSELKIQNTGIISVTSSGGAINLQGGSVTIESVAPSTYHTVGNINISSDATLNLAGTTGITVVSSGDIEVQTNTDINFLSGGNAVFTANSLGLPTGTSNPLSPASGYTYYNTATHQVRVYNGSTWVEVGGGITDLTGDVTGTGPGSTATTIAANVVDNTKLAQASALSVLGNDNNTTGNVNYITAAVDGYVLQRSGTNLAFGPIPAASVPSGINATKIGTGTVDNTEFGYLDGVTSAIQTQLNAKQATGNYVTSLTGDITGSGPGAAATTLATVNSNVGSFGNATNTSTVTVNAKGLVTAASNTPIQIAESQVTNLVSDLAGKQATGNYVTSLTGEVTASGPGASAATVTNSAVIGKVLTGYTSGAGTVAATDTILQGIQKLNGNDALAVAKSTLTTKGDIYVATGASTVVRQGIGSDGQVLVADSSQTNGLKWAAASGGTGSGLKNYLTGYTASTASGVANTGNGDLELGTTAGFSLGNVSIDVTTKFPTGAATFGSGAAGTLSISAVSTNQLAGLYSLSYASSAATTAGNFVASNAFFIDKEDQAKVLQFKIAYTAQTNPTNGNFSGTSSNSFGVAIYDVTNSAWIQPAGVFNFVQNSGTGIASGTFQTTSNSTQYRIVVYNANVTLGAITMYFDDFFVGPQITAAGAAMSDWVNNGAATITATSVNPTKGTSTNDKVWTRRVGDSLAIRWEFTMTGAGSGGTGSYLFNLPAGYTIDTAKITASGTTGSVNTVGLWAASTAGYKAEGNVQVYSSTQLVFDVIGSNGTTTIIGNWASSRFDFAGTGQWSFEALVPISGWSSNTVMSNDTDTRVVATSVRGTPTGTLSTTYASATSAVFGTVDYDLTGSYAAGVFTCPVAGIYEVAGQIGFTSAAGATGNVYVVQLGKNASTLSQAQVTLAGATTAEFEVPFIFQAQCKAGDTLDVRGGATTTTPAYAGGTAKSYMAIKRLSGPAVISSTESVTMKYTTTSGQSIPNNTDTTLLFGTKLYDSHNAYNTSTGVFTAPISGKYRITSGILYNASFASIASLSYQKNGTLQTYLSYYSSLAQTRLQGSDSIDLLAGETIIMRTTQASGSSQVLTTNAPYNTLTIERIGS